MLAAGGVRLDAKPKDDSLAATEAESLASLPPASLRRRQPSAWMPESRVRRSVPGQRPCAATAPLRLAGLASSAEAFSTTLNDSLRASFRRSAVSSLARLRPSNRRKTLHSRLSAASADATAGESSVRLSPPPIGPGASWMRRAAQLAGARSRPARRVSAVDGGARAGGGGPLRQHEHCPKACRLVADHTVAEDPLPVRVHSARPGRVKLCFARRTGCVKLRLCGHSARWPIRGTGGRFWLTVAMGRAGDRGVDWQLRASRWPEGPSSAVTGVWCNGSTTGQHPVDRGSNP